MLVAEGCIWRLPLLADKITIFDIKVYHTHQMLRRSSLKSFYTVLKLKMADLMDEEWNLLNKLDKITIKGPPLEHFIIIIFFGKDKFFV